MKSLQNVKTGAVITHEINSCFHKVLRVMILKVCIRIHISFLFFLAFFIIVSRIPVLLCILLASLIHEVSHIFIGVLLGGELTEISIRCFGAVIRINGLSYPNALFATIAGPISSLLLICFMDYLPSLAVCGFIQGVFNLLPIYPLDGGRIVALIRYQFQKNALH